jgi:hypothetical protein
MGPSPRSGMMTREAALLVRSALQDASAAHAETALPGEAQARRTSFGVNLYIIPPANAFLQLAHAKVVGVQPGRGRDAALTNILRSPGCWQAKSD